MPSSPSSPFPTGAAVPKAVLRVRRSSREQLDVHAIDHSEAQHWVRRMSKELDLATPSTAEALRCGRQEPGELLDLRRAGSAQVSSSPARTDRRACLYPNQSIPASPAPDFIMLFRRGQVSTPKRHADGGRGLLEMHAHSGGGKRAPASAAIPKAVP